VEQLKLLRLASKAAAPDATSGDRAAFRDAVTPNVVLELIAELAHAQHVIDTAQKHWTTIAGPQTTELPSPMHRILRMKRGCP